MKSKPTRSTSSSAPILEAEAIQRALRRIGHEIIEANPELDSVVLAGIPSRGIEIAERIAEFISTIAKKQVETAVIDVAMHRDDVGSRAQLPIRADYVGKNLPTAANERIRVRLQQTDDEPDAVWLEKNS